MSVFVGKVRAGIKDWVSNPENKDRVDSISGGNEILKMLDDPAYEALIERLLEENSNFLGIPKAGDIEKDMNTLFAMAENNEHGFLGIVQALKEDVPGATNKVFSALEGKVDFSSIGEVEPVKAELEKATAVALDLVDGVDVSAKSAGNELLGHIHSYESGEGGLGPVSDSIQNLLKVSDSSSLLAVSENLKPYLSEEELKRSCNDKPVFSEVIASPEDQSCVFAPTR